MPNSGDASRKCFSGVLSRLLCSGSLPTHPSEQLIEPSTRIEKSGDQKGGISTKQVASSTPGVVARLMGLESFPTTAPRDRTLGAYFRSKSVNSIDFLSYFDPIKHGHRRVRTSVSFHYQGQGVIDDFSSVILHENRDDGEGLFIRKVPDEKNREYFQVSNGPGKNRKNFQVSDRQGKNRENFQDPGPGNLASQKKEIRKKKSVKLKERRPIIKEQNSKEKMVGSKCVRKKKKNLVHCNKKKIHPGGIVPEVARNSRNQGRPQTANSQSPYSRISNSENMLIRENGIIPGEIERKAKNKESCYYKRMVEEICMLSEENVKENWIHEKFKDFEEIIQQFGDEILEMMLNEFVDELVILFGTMEE